MYKVKFKYKIGQMVTLTHCPSFSNMQHLHYVCEHEFHPKEYKVKAYFWTINEGGEEEITYQLDAYCDEFIQYHNRIPEEHLEGEINEHTDEFDFLGIHDEVIEIGDTVYSDFYYSSVEGKYVEPEFTFAKQLKVIGLRYSKEGDFYRDGKIVENTKKDVIGEIEYTLFMPSSQGNKTSETAEYLLKTIDDRFVEDYVKGCKRKRFNPTREQMQYSHFKDWLDYLEVYDDVCNLYKKKTPKKNTTVKKEEKKTVKDMLVGLTKKEKAELLKELNKELKTA